MTISLFRSLPGAIAAAVLALTDEKLASRLDTWRAAQSESVAERPSEAS